jgi:hypothetical protein
MNKPESIGAMSAVYMREAEFHMQRMMHLLEICQRYSAVDDAAGFYVAGQKVLEDGRAFSKLLKDISLSFSHENKK